MAGLAADLLRPGVVGLGAWIGPRLVGCVRLRPARDGAGDDAVSGGPDETVELARYCVAPDVRGHGIGRALLDAALRSAPPGGRLWLITGSRSEDNVRLYRAAGFVETDRFVDALGIELLRMERMRG